MKLGRMTFVTIRGEIKFLSVMVEIMFRGMTFTVIAVLLSTLMISHATNDQKSIDILVERLGSGTFKVRKASDADLRARERTIVPLLEKYSDSKDPEIRMRVLEIVEHLKEKPLTLNFADENLTASIKTKTGKEVVTDKDIPMFVGLNAVSKDIKSIEGLSQLIKLRDIRLEDNSISDLSEFKTMPELNFVDLSYNSITNIAPFVEYAKARNHRRNLVLRLTGNPLPESVDEQIKTLRSLGVNVEFIREIPLPDYMKVSFRPKKVKPYEGLDFWIKPDTQEEFDTFYEKYGWIKPDMGTTINGKTMSAELVRQFEDNKIGSESWHFFSNWRVMTEEVRPFKPGKYTYRFVFKGKNYLLTCPPVDVTVTVPEKYKQMVDDLEKKRANEFFLHEKGYRTPAESDKPQIAYDALIKFLDKYPDSYLNSVIRGRIHVIHIDDLSGSKEIHSDDRKKLAEIAVRVNKSYIKTTTEELDSAREAMKKIKGGGSLMDRQKTRIDRLQQWLKHAQEKKP